MPVFLIEQSHVKASCLLLLWNFASVTDILNKNFVCQIIFKTCSWWYVSCNKDEERNIYDIRNDWNLFCWLQSHNMLTRYNTIIFFHVTVLVNENLFFLRFEWNYVNTEKPFRYRESWKLNKRLLSYPNAEKR